ncbi:DUF1127 domain-containing protein [Tropicimonas sp. IMCC34011]|uniref:DUF1127 domain-containing protein n=1 Tax=Tropicimonas sp. IMCC34011 TaxID=2248759 RepID=UPI000E24A36C|nr:DUF1127 domain-containing protein [Tropicimonas sp. IMCC34011]
MAFITGTHSTDHASTLGSAIAAPFRAFGRFLVSIGESNARLRRVQELQNLTDAQLAKRGLTRDDIVRYVFRDRLY